MSLTDKVEQARGKLTFGRRLKKGFCQYCHQEIGPRQRTESPYVCKECWKIEMKQRYG